MLSSVACHGAEPCFCTSTSRVSSNPVVFMSEQSFAEIDAPQTQGGTTLHNPFETECFDADAVFKRYGINPAVHSWAEVSKDENLYKQLTAFMGKHGLQQRSLSPLVVVKEMDEAEELLKDEDPTKQISLKCGLGLIHLNHTLDDGRTVAIKALHQRRGPIVGGRCGAETWENIVVFAEGPDGRDTLQSFLEYVVNSECRRTRPNMYTIYRWQVEHGYWKRLASKTNRNIESVVLPDETKEKIISDIDSFISRETFSSIPTTASHISAAIFFMVYLVRARRLSSPPSPASTAATSTSCSQPTPGSPTTP